MDEEKSEDRGGGTTPKAETSTSRIDRGADAVSSPSGSGAGTGAAGSGDGHNDTTQRVSSSRQTLRDGFQRRDSVDLSRTTVHVDWDWNTGSIHDEPSADEAMRFFRERDRKTAVMNKAALEDGLSGEEESPAGGSSGGETDRAGFVPPDGTEYESGREPESEGVLPPEFHEVPRKKKKHKKSHRLLRVLIGIAVILAVLLFLMSPVFNIKAFRVEGNHYYSDSEVIHIATAQKGVNLFSIENRRTLKKKLLQNPYFTDVKFRSRLPSTLVIRVTERRQVAAALYGDKYIVIDKNARVLRITDVKPDITTLKGLTLSRIKVGEKLQAEESGSLQYMLDMIRETQKGDFYFREINMSGVIVKAYITKTLAVKCSASQLKKAVKDGNLQKVVNKLFKSKIYRGTISIGKSNYMYFSPSVS